jgi:DNA-binding NarL/FixJ family response regulator
MIDPIRVVVVDDQELFRAGVVVIVDAQPDLVAVAAAGDGTDAVRLVDEHEPDVVLIDLRMPSTDGVEATRQILMPERVSRRARPVRVLAVTPFSPDDRAATAIRYGASGFLLKDSTPALLCDAIRSVYAGNAVVAPTDPAATPAAQFQAPGVSRPWCGDCRTWSSAMRSSPASPRSTAMWARFCAC